MASEGRVAAQSHLDHSRGPVAPHLQAGLPSDELAPGSLSGVKEPNPQNAEWRKNARPSRVLQGRGALGWRDGSHTSPSPEAPGLLSLYLLPVKWGP